MNQLDGEYEFDGWYLDDTYTTQFEVNENGIPTGWTESEWSKTDTIHVYAKYKKLDIINYVVSLYGIEADTLFGDKVSGLTFGPTTWGEKQTNEEWSEKIYDQSHTPSERTALGNYHRCLHNDSWRTIIEWSQKDPYVYEQCYGNEKTPSCTKVIEVQVPKQIKSTNQSDWDIINEKGGYTSMFLRSLQAGARQWNPSYKGGWEASKARTTLQTLLTGFPEELQAVIAEKQVSYNIGYGEDNTEIKICYDKLWLLAQAEIYSTSEDKLKGESTVLSPLADKNYERFQQLGITEWNRTNCRTKAYGEDGTTKATMNNAVGGWLLRSPFLGFDRAVRFVGGDLGYSNYNTSMSSSWLGLAPAFSLPGPSGTGN